MIASLYITLSFYRPSLFPFRIVTLKVLYYYFSFLYTDHQREKDKDKKLLPLILEKSLKILY